MHPDCSICAHAIEHGSWPTSHRGTHCMECHRSWVGLKESHCTVCYQHFTSDLVADRHEPYCSPDPTEAAEALSIAAREDGNPVFDIRHRRDGPAWILWRKEERHFAA